MIEADQDKDKDKAPMGSIMINTLNQKLTLNLKIKEHRAQISMGHEMINHFIKIIQAVALILETQQTTKMEHLKIFNNLLDRFSKQEFNSSSNSKRLEKIVVTKIKNGQCREHKKGHGAIIELLSNDCQLKYTVLPPIFITIIQVFEILNILLMNQSSNKNKPNE